MSLIVPTLSASCSIMVSRGLVHHVVEFLESEKVVTPWERGVADIGTQ